jgi:hypothetical protein
MSASRLSPDELLREAARFLRSDPGLAEQFVSGLDEAAIAAFERAFLVRRIGRATDDARRGLGDYVMIDPGHLTPPFVPPLSTEDF